MGLRIRPYEAGDYERVLEICIAAFTPIHKGFEAALGHEIFALRLHDWKEQYAKQLSGIDPKNAVTKVSVAEEDDAVVGFMFTIMEAERKTGEIGLNAADPRAQGRGIGKAMYEFALADLKQRGAEVAYVGTGGDAAHAPARAAYEAMGFDRVIPSIHYFRRL